MEKIKENKMTGAVAIFAKTIGLSPVKTRLAATIGKSRAEEFYHLSVTATAEIIAAAKQQNNFTPYWALAEKESLDHQQWQNFDRIWTGAGDLGERLHHIYHSLIAKHDYVILLGSDSPQLTPALITQSIKKIEQPNQSCIIGATPDGGFYLFSAKTPIAKNIWTNVQYSQNTTLKELQRNLNQYNIPIEWLTPQMDVDMIDDLKPLLAILKENPAPLPSQKNLCQWLEKQINIPHS